MSELHLPLTLLIVFASAKLLAELFDRLGQPGIVGEILAGVLLGPSLLNWVQPDEILTALSQLGVMFLLFRVGLEVKASELMRVGGTALVVAILGVVMPFLAGWAIIQAAGLGQTEGIFIGAAMVATSVGITAHVLATKGLLRELASQIILAAAVIDDVLGLLVLAVVSSLAKGHVNVWGLVSTAVLAIGFTVLVAWFGTRTMRHVVPRVSQRLAVGEVQFNIALLLLLGLSVLAVFTGMAAIIGAFLAGMALSESMHERVHDLFQGICELLVPFFLAGIGLRLDASVFANGGTLLLCGTIVIAAVLTKVIGCGLGAVRLGASDALRVGVGMVPRGEVGMVVAQIGLASGIIQQQVYAVVVAMSVLTTLIAPPLLKFAYRDCVPSAPKEDFTLT